jgi:hypothetical protein
MTILAVILIALASIIALGNVSGCISVVLRRRRGETGGYSSIPLLSLLFCGLAWLLSGDQLAPWVLLPALLDPATWSLIVLPAYLLLRSPDADRERSPLSYASAASSAVTQTNIVNEIGWRLGVLASLAAQERYMVNATKDNYLLPDEALNHAQDVVDALDNSSSPSTLRGMDPDTAAAVRRFSLVWDTQAQQIDALLEIPWEELVRRNDAWRELRAAAQTCLNDIGFDLTQWERDKGYAA